MPLLCVQGDALLVAAGTSLLRITAAGAEEVPLPSPTPSAPATILSVTTHHQLVLVMLSDKRICVLSLASSPPVSFSSACSKKPVAMAVATVSGKGDALLYADRLGEVWGADLPSMQRKALLGGHTASVITDMAVSPCGAFVATSDRDEKIRLSHLPSFNVSAYCLGHSDVVTSISFLPGGGPQLLCSVGWDFRLCLWDLTGSLLNVCAFKEETEGVVAAVVEAEEEEAAEEEAEEEDGDEEGDGEGGEHARVYDERQAGDFPWRVATLLVGGRAVAAVLFRNEALLRLVPVLSIEGRAVLGAPVVVPLLAVPLDVTASDDLLTLLLPPPGCLVHVGCAWVEDQLTFSTSTSAASEHLASYCATTGMCLSCIHFYTYTRYAGTDLRHVFTFEDGTDGGTAMKKHMLDRPFNTVRAPRRRTDKD